MGTSAVYEAMDGECGAERYAVMKSKYSLSGYPIRYFVLKSNASMPLRARHVASFGSYLIIVLINAINFRLPPAQIPHFYFISSRA
jgi:hypothetical protein